MKKMFIGAVAIALLAGAALAGQVHWFVGYGVYPHDATDLVDTETPGTGILSQFDVFWQLINAGADGVANPIDINNSNGYLSGDDSEIDHRYLSKGNGGIFDDWMYAPTDDTSIFSSDATDGSYAVYQRIWEGVNENTPPTQGTWYWQSATEEITVTSVEPAIPAIVTAGKEWGDHGFQPDQQVNVPEPATMSLLGLVALAMVLRRKLRK